MRSLSAPRRPPPDTTAAVADEARAAGRTRGRTGAKTDTLLRVVVVVPASLALRAAAGSGRSRCSSVGNLPAVVVAAVQESAPRAFCRVGGGVRRRRIRCPA